MPVVVTPQFQAALTKARIALEFAAATAMQFAIEQVAREAPNFAPWNPDGTEGPTNRSGPKRWVVSGYSRASFIGAVPKYFAPAFRAGSETDKFGHFHSFEPWTPDSETTPGTVEAFIWRYSNNTGYLQSMEKGEQAQGEWTPPGEITEVRVLRQMSDQFWAQVATVFAEQMRLMLGSASGGFIF